MKVKVKVLMTLEGQSIREQEEALRPESRDRPASQGELSVRQDPIPGVFRIGIPFWHHVE